MMPGRDAVIEMAFHQALGALILDRAQDGAPDVTHVSVPIADLDLDLLRRFVRAGFEHGVLYGEALRAHPEDAPTVTIDTVLPFETPDPHPLGASGWRPNP